MSVIKIRMGKQTFVLPNVTVLSRQHHKGRTPNKHNNDNNKNAKLTFFKYIRFGVCTIFPFALAPGNVIFGFRYN